MDLAGLETLIRPTLDGMGYALVRLQLTGGPRPTLQVMAERADEKPMAIEDCEAISHALSAKLDVEDPIAAAYTLEVSSPGIDRPLTRARDYQRFAGHVAKVETRAPVEGRRRFSGRIVNATETHVRLRLEGENPAAPPEFEIPIAEIHKAKLKLTDELIAAVGHA